MNVKPPTQKSQRTDAIRSAHRRKTVGREAGRGRPDDLPRLVGAMFRAAREAQLLSQDQLAELTERAPGGAVSRTTISSIERGRSLPAVDTLLSLTTVLHFEAAEVLERIHLAVKAPDDLILQSLEELDRRAKDLFWAGDYRGALAIYDTTFEKLVLDPPVDRGVLQRLQARVEINRAVALRRCNALKAARASAERAVELCQVCSEFQSEAYVVLASLLSLEGRLVLALDAAERGVALSGSRGPKEQADALSQKGNVLYRSGRFEEARNAFVDAVPKARAARDHHGLVQLEGNVAACLLDLGRVAPAKKRFMRAVSLARRHGDLAMEASWLIELGRVCTLHENGGLDEGERYGQAGLHIARENGHELTVFRAEWLLHLVALERDSEALDRHRIAHLRRLYPRVKAHRAQDAVREYERQVLRIGEPPKGTRR